MPDDCIWFQTAWAEPKPVIEALARRYPDITIEHEWANEDLGEGCGRRVYENGEEIETGIKKVGAFLGDYVEVGCNSVLCPGSVIGPHSNIYPLSRVRGVVKANSIFKKEGDIVEKKGNV